MIEGCSELRKMVPSDRIITNEETHACALHVLNCKNEECKKIVSTIKQAHSEEEAVAMVHGKKAETMFDI